MASQTSPILPLVAPEKTTHELHQLPTSLRSTKRDILCLAAACLTSFTTGFNEIPSLVSPGPTSSNISLLHTSITAALPLSIGSILAAAFLGPLLRSPRGHAFTIFSLSNLLCATAHASLFLIPATNIPTTVLAHLLIGVSNGFNLTLAISHGQLSVGVAHGLAAAGVSIRTILPAPEHHRCGLGLAFLSAGVAWLASTTRKQGRSDDAEAQIQTQAQGQPPLSLPRSQPPGASNLTTLPITLLILTLTHHALITFLPTLSPPNTTTYLLSDSDFSIININTTTLFWTGIAVGRVTLPQSHSQRQFKLTSAALAATLTSLHFLWTVCFIPPSVISRVGDVVVALMGVLLGAMYPCVVSAALQSVGEDERVNVLGIVNAFGSVGAVTGVVVVGLVEACFFGRVGLVLISSGLFGGMVVCWYLCISERVGEGEKS